MKAILEFSIPDDKRDYDYAMSGLDALLVIEELEIEIRNKLKYDLGDFKDFSIEVYHNDGTIASRSANGCNDTLERVWEVLQRLKQKRNLPKVV